MVYLVSESRGQWAKCADCSEAGDEVVYADGPKKRAQGLRDMMKQRCTGLCYQSGYELARVRQALAYGSKKGSCC